MRVLVSGSAGFIGYHLCVRLLDDGHEVVGLDNLSTGQRANADELSAQPHFHFVEHDIVNPPPVEGAFDLVCNLACPASPADFDSKRLDILAACSGGVWTLLEFAQGPAMLA